MWSWPVRRCKPKKAYLHLVEVSLFIMPRAYHMQLLPVRIDRFDRTVLVDCQLGEFDAAFVVRAA